MDVVGFCCRSGDAMLSVSNEKDVDSSADILVGKSQTNGNGEEQDLRVWRCRSVEAEFSLVHRLWRKSAHDQTRHGKTNHAAAVVGPSVSAPMVGKHQDEEVV